MAKILEAGDKAPKFDIPNQDGNMIKLDDLLDKWSVIYFYPRDDTPGCTIEAKEFTELSSKFEEHGATIYGCLLYTSPSPRDS